MSIQTNTARHLLKLLVDGQTGPAPANYTFKLLDALTDTTVKSSAQASPPGDPDEGDTYIVATSATGGFAAQDDKIAVYIDSGWEFIPPVTGLRIWDETTGEDWTYDGAAWVRPHQKPGHVGFQSMQGSTASTGITSLAILADGLATKSNGLCFPTDVVLESVAFTAQHADSTSPPATWTFNVYKNASGTPAATATITLSGSVAAIQASGGALSSEVSLTANTDFVGFDATGTSLDQLALRVMLKYRTA